jgi:DNA polymerase III epsilon subunit-like protein
MIIGVFDFETTDKVAADARITQCAFSLYDTDDQWREIYHYSSLCVEDDYPEISPGAQAITGLTLDKIKKYGEKTSSVIEKFASYFSNLDYLCGHNIRNYDIPVLEAESQRYGVDVTHLPVTIDTRFDCPWPSHIETRKLLYLAAEYGVANPMAHSARHDVDLTVFLLKQFDLDEVIKRSKSKDITIQAMVTYDTKELAKERKFSWDGTNKIWVKQIKELDFDTEVSMAGFKVVKVG